MTSRLFTSGNVRALLSAVLSRWQALCFLSLAPLSLIVCRQRGPDRAPVTAQAGAAVLLPALADDPSPPWILPMTFPLLFGFLPGLCGATRHVGVSYISGVFQGTFSPGPPLPSQRTTSLGGAESCGPLTGIKRLCGNWCHGPPEGGLKRGEGDWSLPVCREGTRSCVSVSVCVYISVRITVSQYMYLCLCVRVCLSFCVPVCVSMYVCISVCLFACVSCVFPSYSWWHMPSLACGSDCVQWPLSKQTWVCLYVTPHPCAGG